MSDFDISAPEVQDAIAAAVEKATAPLIAKRDELLGEVKKLRKGREIDPADYTALEAERDDLKDKLSDATKALGKATKAADDATKKAVEIDSAYSRSIADGALMEALSKAGVTNPVYVKAAKAMLAPGLTVVDENGVRVVKAGDKALADHITEWAGSDDGKAFVTAPDSIGGGSQGGRGTHPNQPLTSTQKIAAGLAKL